MRVVAGAFSWKASTGASNVVQTPSGNRLTVHFFTGIFQYPRSVDTFQVIEEKSGSILVRIVPRAAFDPEEWKDLERQIREKGDPDLAVDLEIVECIAPEMSNKRRFVVSQLTDTH